MHNASRILPSVLAALLLLFSSSSTAIEITFEHDPLDDYTNPLDPDATRLLELLEYVGSVYEDMIEDRHSMTIRYRYDPNVTFTNGVFRILQTSEGNGVQRTKVGLVRIRPVPGGDPARFYYYDPTPELDEEFSMSQTLFRDLTTNEQSERFSGAVPELFEAGFGGRAVTGTFCDDSNCTDLLTILFHEIGHGMGLSSYEKTDLLAETSDGDFDVDPDLVGGNVMAEKVRGMESNDSRAHVFGSGSGAYALMTKNPRRRRRRPSATDLLAMAAVFDWQSLDLPRKEFLGGGVWHAETGWVGGSWPGGADDAFVRHGGTVFLADNGFAHDLLIDEDSFVATGAHLLRAFGTTTLGPTGEVVLLVGGAFGPVFAPTFQSDRLVVRPNSEVRLSGSTSSGGEAVVRGGEASLLGGSISVVDASAARWLPQTHVDARTLVRVGLDGRLVMEGPLVGSADLLKQGYGTLTLGGANGLWTGDLLIDEGTVIVPPGDGLSTTTTVDLRLQVSEIDFSAEGEVVGGLRGRGVVLLGAGNLEVGGNDADTVFRGHVRVQDGGTAGFVKDGTGTMAFLHQASIEGVSRVRAQGGGTLILSGASTVTTPLLEAADLATVRVEQSATVRVFAADFSDRGYFELRGGTLVARVFDGVLLNFGGTLSPGRLDDPTATLDISDNFAQSGGRLLIEIGGAVAGQDHDQIRIPVALASLGGDLEIELVDGFVPSPGQSFTILTAGEKVFGTFETVAAPVFDGLTFAVVYEPNRVRLTVVELPPTIFADGFEAGVVSWSTSTG